MLRRRSWVKAGFPDLALEIAKMRVKEAQDINAEVIVTACLFCKNNLQDAMDAVGSSIEYWILVI